MLPAVDLQLVRLAQEQGLVTPSQVESALREAARREASGRPSLVGQILVEKGALTGSALARTLFLLAERQAAAAGPSARETLPGGFAEVPAEDSSATDATVASRPAGVPGRRFGKYDVVEELGRGAMGVVYKAWRADLGSWFAVKVMLAGRDASPAAVARFHNEARAAARLHHPGIVAVHDVGVDEGKTWIAMEYVEGAGLDAVLADPVAHGLVPARTRSGARRKAGLDAAAAVRIAQEIAEAVHAAHEAGVIHRDLKPENVIRTAAGRIKIADFGLAKVVEGEAAVATRTGTVLGSPAYMSPEQAQGRNRELDARSDVYQIGVILYEMLTGRVPHLGDTAMDVILRVANEEPAPPRWWNPAIDRDAETLCRKAMAHDPADRYASARELAEDCRRFLEGEELRARPEGLVARLLRRARRHRGPVALGAAALLALAFAAGAALQKQRADRAAEGARAAHARVEAELVDRLRTIAGLSVRAALAVRRAGQALEPVADEFLRPLEDAARAAIEKAPGLAEPHYHLGRMARALLRFDEALAEQERALVKEPGFAPARYERAILRARRWGLRLGELRDAWLAEQGQRLRAGGGALPAPPDPAALTDDDVAARAWRDGLAEDLRRLEQAASAGAAFPPGLLASGRAHLAETSARSDAERAIARDRFEEALKEDPALEEAHQGLSRLAEAAHDLEGAIAACTRGIAADAGYLPHRLERARLRNVRGLERQAHGEDPQVDFRAAEEDLSQALGLHPKDAGTWLQRGNVRVNLGTVLLRAGQDPVATFEGAIADFGAALERAPDHVEAVVSRGKALVNLAVWRGARGEDPDPLYERAVEDFTGAIARAPDRPAAWLARGTAHLNRAYRLRATGRDPGEAFARGEEDLDRALELDPRSAEGWSIRGKLALNRGNHGWTRGADPVAHWERAAECFANVVALDPGRVETWIDRANLETNAAIRDRQLGLDAAARWARAQADLERVLEIDSQQDEAWFRLGHVWYNRGVAEQEAGRDPTGLLARAEEAYGRASGNGAVLVEARLWRGHVRRQQAGWREARGRECVEAYRGAVEDYSEVLQIQPMRTEALVKRSEVRGNLGAHLGPETPGGRECYRASREDARAALARLPESVDSWIALGFAELALDEPGEAVTAFEQAERLDPASAWRFQDPLAEARRRAGR